MLMVAKDMYGASVEGSDGRAGTLYDLLFDDRSWKLRHLVVSMDRWFLGRQVLLDPDMIEWAAWPEQRLRARLTKEQVQHSPGVDTDLPAARRASQAAAQVLVWEAYWANVLDTPMEPPGDPHLRSTKMLSGLHLHCIDGQLGHVDDFLIDPQTWSVQDLVVDTRNWWPGKHVLVEPTLIESISWADREIRLSLRREEVEDRPAYQHKTPADEPVAGGV
jgi:sporulation protein YlmC with PRC-barrel domain